MWERLSPVWRACVEQAWEARCARSIPIGAVVTGPDGQILARGRNRANEPRAASAQFTAGSRLAHAEINALMALDVPGLDYHTCAMYTTTEPCPMCAGAIVMCSLRQVAYASRDPWAGATELYEQGEYLRAKNMRVEGPTDAQLEILLIGLQVDYFLWRTGLKSTRWRMARDNGFFASMKRYSPPGFALGLDLRNTSLVEKMVEQGCSAEEMLDILQNRRAQIEK